MTPECPIRKQGGCEIVECDPNQCTWLTRYQELTAQYDQAAKPSQPNKPPKFTRQWFPPETALNSDGSITITRCVPHERNEHRVHRWRISRTTHHGTLDSHRNHPDF